MTRFGKIILAGCASVALLVAAEPAAQAKTMGPTAAAIVGGVAGVAVGAAIADAAKPKKKIVYPAYQPPYPPGQYDPYFNQAYSPVAGVVCYPAQRACYNNGGTVNGTWTRRAFGY